MPRRPLLLFLVLAGCTPTGRAWRLDSVVLSAAPSPVAFGAHPLGALATESVTLTNSGTNSVSVSLTVDPPFRVDQAAVDIGAGGSAIVTVSFAPADYLPAASNLVVSATSTTLEVPVSGSTDPDSDADGHDAVPAGGDDCDDLDADIHPGAPEICYDGIDDDCDGIEDDMDCDGDGVAVETDCDDADPTVSPDTAESGPDGRDDDCDGLIDENLHTPGALFVSELLPGSAASVEVCNGSGDVQYLDRLRLETSAGSYTLDPGDARDDAPLEPGDCAAFDALAAGYFSWTLVLPFDAAGDTLTIWSDTIAVDRVVVTTSWRWSEDVNYALAADHFSAAANDDDGSWCAPSDASWGSPTPDAACP